MARPKKISKRVPERINITQEEYDRIRQAFSKGLSNLKSVDDPVLAADRLIDCCLNGTTKNGRIWYNAPYDLRGRLRLYGFDLDKMEMIPDFYTNRGRPKEDWHKPETSKGVPKELEVADERVNNEAITAPITYAEQKEYNRRYRAYLKEYPHLNNPADVGLLELLCRIEVMSLRRADMALQNKSNRDMSGAIDKDMADNMRKLQETMGIAGHQRQKLMGSIQSGSVAELVERFDEYVRDGKHLEIEFQWWKEEAALLLRKADRLWPNGDPEINDAVFKRLMGVEMAVAKEMIGDSYSRSLTQAKKRALELIRNKESQLNGREGK